MGVGIPPSVAGPDVCPDDEPDALGATRVLRVLVRRSSRGNARVLCPDSVLAALPPNRPPPDSRHSSAASPKTVGQDLQSLRLRPPCHAGAVSGMRRGSRPYAFIDLNSDSFVGCLPRAS